MDCGNFPFRSIPETESRLRMTLCLSMPKTYYGGGEWYTLDLDYAKIGKYSKRSRIFRDTYPLNLKEKADAHIGVPTERGNAPARISVK